MCSVAFMIRVALNAAHRQGGNFVIAFNGVLSGSSPTVVMLACPWFVVVALYSQSNSLALYCVDYNACRNHWADTDSLWELLSHSLPTERH